MLWMSTTRRVAISSSLPVLLLPPMVLLLLLLLLLDAAELENMVGGTYDFEVVSCSHGGVGGAPAEPLLLLIIGDWEPAGDSSANGLSLYVDVNVGRPKLSNLLIQRRLSLLVRADCAVVCGSVAL